MLNIAVTVWWLVFFSALGLCLGSFLNVVIYRLPMGLALSSPVWSFCPNCQNRIAWYDNLPVLSYFRLRGRCRNCWQPISPRYPLVELMTAILVILLLDRFFIGAAQSTWDYVDLNWKLGDDWPAYLAHVILFSSLMAMSAIDIQFYWVDIRFTHFAAAAGVLLHAVWSPTESHAWITPPHGTAIATTSAFAGFALVWIVLQFTTHHPPETEIADGPPDETNTTKQKPAARLALWLTGALFLALLFFAGAEEVGANPVPYALRAGAVLLFFFLIIVYEASHVRDADTEIVEAIESEAPAARRMTLVELATLLPGVFAGCGVLWWAYTSQPAAEGWSCVMQWKPWGETWQPIQGIVTAINGYVIAAGIGWAIRIVANLVYGKEAFATGDIHMMAAAGCVIGWQMVLLGFVLACFLAVVAWVALLPFKKTRAIPLGPWLWIGFLTAVVYREQLTQTTMIQNVVSLWDLLFFNISQHPLFAGPS